MDYLVRGGAGVDNFNASSHSVASLLEIWKIVASTHPQTRSRFKKEFVRKCGDRSASEEEENAEPTSGVRLSRANFANRYRWLKLYGGPPSAYLHFILGHIEMLLMRPTSDNWTHYDRETMIRHYSKKYVEHKCKQVEAVLRRGDSLCIDIGRQLEIPKS